MIEGAFGCDYEGRKSTYFGKQVHAGYLFVLMKKVKTKNNKSYAYFDFEIQIGSYL